MLTDIEMRVLQTVTSFQGAMPADQLADMSELVRAGEAGIALENLCTQLHEYDVAVPEASLREIEGLCGAMKLQSKYWERLRQASRDRD